MPRSLRTGELVPFDPEIEKTARHLRKEQSLRREAESRSRLHSNPRFTIATTEEGIILTPSKSPKSPTSPKHSLHTTSDYTNHPSSSSRTTHMVVIPSQEYSLPLKTQITFANSQHSSPFNSQHSSPHNSPPPSPKMAAEEARTMRQWGTVDVVQQPLCITFPDVEHLEIKTGLINLLPTFHGLENEDPHKFLKDFHLACMGTKNHRVREDQVKLRAFPFALKDLARDW